MHETWKKKYDILLFNYGISTPPTNLAMLEQVYWSKRRGEQWTSPLPAMAWGAKEWDVEGLLDIEGSLVVRCGVNFFRYPMDDEV